MPKIDPLRGRIIPPSIAPSVVVLNSKRRLANWLQAYRELAQNSESPESFHLWVGLGTIAGATQRKIWIETEYFTVYTNQFIILTGPAGKVKKSSALRLGKRLLKQVPDIHFTTSATSVAGLIEQFVAITNPAHQSLTCYSGELASLFGVDMDGMIDFLTDIYDGEPDWDKQTRSHSLEKIARPWLNLMAGTTPTWLGDNLSRTATEGGFVSRSIFVFEDQRILRDPLPARSDASRALERDLVNDLAHISTIGGQFTLSREANKFYREWYLDQSRFPDVVDPRTATYYERKAYHVLKVAMALSLAEKDDLVLELRDITTAMQLLSLIEPGMKRAFSTVGGNVLANDLDRVQALIVANEGMEYRELIAATYAQIDKKQLDEILEALVLMGEIKQVITSKGARKYLPA